MASAHSSANRGEIEYNHLSAVLFNYVRSSPSGFKASTAMPWLTETRRETTEADKQRISLFDMTLRQMIKVSGICLEIAT